MNKLTKTLKNKKGFTLMEVIVVLIILAVLAAALIPTFLGFVDQARHATAIAEARLGMTAAQAVVTDAIGRGQTPAAALASLNTDLANTRFGEFIGNEAPGTFSTFVFATDDSNRIAGLAYLTDDFLVTISETAGTVVTDAPSNGGGGGG